MVRSENADIKQKQDPARLQIQHCQLVLINTYAPQGHSPEIKDSPLTQVSNLMRWFTHTLTHTHTALFTSVVRCLLFSWQAAVGEMYPSYQDAL